MKRQYRLLKIDEVAPPSVRLLLKNRIIKEVAREASDYVFTVVPSELPLTKTFDTKQCKRKWKTRKKKSNFLLNFKWKAAVLAMATDNKQQQQGYIK